jgi:hypothetical protein
MSFPCDPIKEAHPGWTRKEIAEEMAKIGKEKDCHLLCVIDNECFPKKS